MSVKSVRLRPWSMRGTWTEEKVGVRGGVWGRGEGLV
jgi:hypothetical protein